jgi:hypothetical protein
VESWRPSLSLQALLWVDSIIDAYELVRSYDIDHVLDSLESNAR